jgi:hypothetical protein
MMCRSPAACPAGARAAPRLDGKPLRQGVTARNLHNRVADYQSVYTAHKVAAD